MPRKVSKAKKPAQSMLTSQRNKVKATKLEAGPATVRGGQAPGAGTTVRKPVAKPAAKPSGNMVNSQKPTMRKLAAKAAQSRKAASGRPLVRKEEMRKLMQKADKIKAAAKNQRVVGDSGQVRAAQNRGKAEVAKAQVRRNARAATQKMASKLSRAKLGRSVQSLGKGGLATIGLTAANAIQDRMLSPQAKARKQATQLTPTGMQDMPKAVRSALSKPAPKPAPKPKKADQPKSTLTQGSFNKKTFDQAFKAARSSGAKEFTWRGKKYNTKMKG